MPFTLTKEEIEARVAEELKKREELEIDISFQTETEDTRNWCLKNL